MTDMKPSHLKQFMMSSQRVKILIITIIIIMTTSNCHQNDERHHMTSDVDALIFGRAVQASDSPLKESQQWKGIIVNQNTPLVNPIYQASNNHKIHQTLNAENYYENITNKISRGNIVNFPLHSVQLFNSSQSQVMYSLKKRRRRLRPKRPRRPGSSSLSSHLLPMMAESGERVASEVIAGARHVIRLMEDHVVPAVGRGAEMLRRSAEPLVASALDVAGKSLLGEQRHSDMMHSLKMAQKHVNKWRRRVSEMTNDLAVMISPGNQTDVPATLHHNSSPQKKNAPLHSDGYSEDVQNATSLSNIGASQWTWPGFKSIFGATTTASSNRPRQGTDVANSLSPGARQGTDVANSLSPGTRRGTDVANSLSPGSRQGTDVANSLSPGARQGTDVANSLSPGAQLNEILITAGVNQLPSWQVSLGSPASHGISASTASASQWFCITPQGGAGVCGRVETCGSLFADITDLRVNVCFFNQNQPGICCPSSKMRLHISNLSGSVQYTDSSTDTTDSSTDTTDSINRVPDSSQSFYVPVSSSISAPPATRLQLSSYFECGRKMAIQSRVVGGRQSSIGQWPWMAAIYLHGIHSSRVFWCGGSLITRSHVITAAHCTRDLQGLVFTASQFSVVLGINKLNGQENSKFSQTRAVDEVIVHPDFELNGFYNDIAVMRLQRSVELSWHVMPVCLPSSLESQPLDHLVSSTATVIGWGSTLYGGLESSALHHTDIPIWSQKHCNDVYFQPILDVFICAGFADGGSDACQGDSGGPLVHLDKSSGRWTQIGIVSFGNQCAREGFPGVYTRLAHFLPWIRQHVH